MRDQRELIERHPLRRLINPALPAAGLFQLAEFGGDETNNHHLALWADA